MTVQTIDYRFLVRGGTAANLATVNEIPLERELVIETDTRNFKLGDGVTNYNDLPYATAEAFLQFRVTAEHVLQYQLSEGGSWVDIADFDDYAGLDDAPSDGSQYARQDGGWVAVAGATPVEMRVDSGYIQYSADGGATWQDLIAESSLKGDEGDPGLSAYQVAVANGFTGAEADWLASLQGEPGDPGPAGGPSQVLSISAATTLAAANHRNKWAEVTNGATITLPPTADWTVGDFTELCQADATQFSVAAGSGVTIASITAALQLKSRYQGGVVVAKIIATNTWRVVGALADA